MRSGTRALLLPAMSGGDWDSGISTRLVLFRDWLPADEPSSKVEDGRVRRARFIGVVKANGVSLADEGGVGRVIPFTIEKASPTFPVLTLLFPLKDQYALHTPAVLD